MSKRDIAIDIVVSKDIDMNDNDMQDMSDMNSDNWSEWSYSPEDDEYDTDTYEEKYEVYRKEMRIIAKKLKSLSRPQESPSEVQEQEEEKDVKEEVVIKKIVTTTHSFTWASQAKSAAIAVDANGVSIITIMQKEKENKEKEKKAKDEEQFWTKIEKKSHAKRSVTFSDNASNDSSMSKARMCSNGNNCRFGKRCKFAHSYDELVVTPCFNGDKCQRIVIVSNIYVDKNPNNKCKFSHPRESKDNFVKRFYETADLPKPNQEYRPTRVNNQRTPPQTPPTKAKTAPKQTKPQDVKQAKIAKLMKEMTNLQQQIKDTTETLASNNGIIKRFAERDNDLCQKTVAKLKINNVVLNETIVSCTARIKTIEVTIEAEKNAPEVEAKPEAPKVAKPACEPYLVKRIVPKTVVVVVKEPEVKQPMIVVKVEPKPASVKSYASSVVSDGAWTCVSSVDGWAHVVKRTVKDQTVVEPKVAPSYASSVVSSAVVSDDGWKQVQQCKPKEQKLVPKVDHKKPKETKTQLCKSVLEKTKCPHGKFCRYAHSVSELSPRECGFGDKCRMVFYSKGKYCNKTSKFCTYIHPEETIENFSQRIII